MKKFKKIMATGVTLLAASMLVACGSSNSSSSSSSSSKSSSGSAKTTKVDFKSKTKTGNSTGGTLNVATVSATPFTAVWLPELQSSAVDSEVVQNWASEYMIKTDENFNFVDGGAVDLKLDNKAKTATMKINPKVKWSDGQKMVAKDLEYPYEILASKDTASERYNEQFENIEGMKEFHEGTAKTISGITYPNGEDGDSIVIHFKEMKVGMDVSGNGWFWENAEPYHYLKDVELKDLKASKKCNTDPVFFGPYKIKHVVSGQSVTFEPNEYYYQGKPRLKSLTVTVVSPATQEQQIKAHKYDLIKVRASIWDNVKKTSGYDFLGVKPMQYSYLGFKVGKFDKDTGKNVQDPNAKMGNEKLRQAIGYAMNVDQVVDKFGHGVGYRDTTLIPESFPEYHDKDAKGYPYQADKAKKLLDEAGYKMGKDGYRTDPDGKPFTITLMSMSSDNDQQTIVNNYIQKWKDVGLKVQLLNGKLTDFNSFYDNLKKDVKGVDMFMAAWGLASEPSRAANMWAEGNPSNYARFNSSKNNELIKDIQSQKAVNDHKYFVDSLIKWQDNMNKEAYVIPTNRSYIITAASDKVENYAVAPLGWMQTNQYYKIGIKK
ncbi:oligopeptide ABC transporter substrate-binding protein [Xylocopilactobacillus apicola]|uniref:Peptide ABC transporter substrate-binding protein n=1 Tax=Xylocopilactobacillus apicola TaxID=2932184 RepID=A0AAU9DBI5_9LACO|nr:oligopeptide ABC transporter substrate-binding protein [Xylocopilactobacillus apicola]BDR58172.1 peptide ABC transporter substrate-binding protein [Xylocopilactobacillus apicola]